MLGAERHLIILKEVEKYKTVTVEHLSNQLSVSENTIRRDLTQLNKEKKLQRIQGGAIFLTPQDNQSMFTRKRVDVNFKEKQIIAKEASKLIISGKTYIIDAGTTTMCLIPYLANTESITILTNSLDICNMQELKPTSSIIASGGVLSHAINSFVGKPAEEFFSNTNADILFLGAKGISKNTLSNENYFETMVKSKMIDASSKVVLLADFSKFGKNGISEFASLEQINTVITDSKTDLNFISYLRNMGIEVIVAE